MYICMYVCMYVRTYVRRYVRMYVPTYVRMYVCTYVRKYTYMYVRTYVCMYVWMDGWMDGFSLAVADLMAQVENVKQESETLYSLLAMADYFLSSESRRIPEAVQCLLATLKVHPPARMKTQICCRLGMILYLYTWNLEEAKKYLNQAVSALHVM